MPARSHAASADRGKVGGVALGVPASAQAASVAMSLLGERAVVLELQPDLARGLPRRHARGPRPPWRGPGPASAPARRSRGRTAPPGPCDGIPGSSSGGSGRRPCNRSARPRRPSPRGSGSRRRGRAGTLTSSPLRMAASASFRLAPRGVRVPHPAGGELVVDPAVIADMAPARRRRTPRASSSRRSCGRRPRCGRGRRGTSARSRRACVFTSASLRSGSTQIARPLHRRQGNASNRALSVGL